MASNDGMTLEEWTVGEIAPLTVQIRYDDLGSDIANPRTHSDEVSELVMDHRRYTLEDRKPDGQETEALERGGMALLYRYLRLTRGAIAFCGIGMYDHSGITVYPVALGGNGRSPFDAAGWDSGLVGFGYVTRERWHELCGDRPESEAQADLEADVRTYGRYLEGQVYGYVIEDAAGDVLDSCWGYLADEGTRDDPHGIAYVKSEAQSQAEWFANHTAVAP